MANVSGNTPLCFLVQIIIFERKHAQKRVYPFLFGIVILILSLLLTSCMVHKKYPSEWSELIPVEENKCPDISGVYGNSSTPYYLSEVLGFEKKIGETFIQIIQLKDGTFEILGCSIEEQKLVNKKFYAKKKYNCTVEGVRTSSYTKSVFKPEGFSPVGYAFGSFYLTRNKDGDLVVKDAGSVVALSIIPPFPIIGFGTDWYRFLQGGLIKQSHDAAGHRLEFGPGRRAESYVNSAGICFSEGQYDLAISDYNMALEIDPRLVDAYIGRGLAYVQKGQYDLAISDYNIALEVSPNNPLAYNNRGRAYYLKGEYDKSWEDFKKAQELGYQVTPKFLDDLCKASGREK